MSQATLPEFVFDGFTLFHLALPIINVFFHRFCHQIAGFVPVQWRPLLGGELGGTGTADRDCKVGSLENV